MALRQFGGFDVGEIPAAEFNQQLDSMTASAGNGRHGSYSARGTGGHMRQRLDAQATWYLGAAFRWVSLGSSTGWIVLAVRDSNTQQVELRLNNTTGQLFLSRNGTQIGSTGTTVLASNTWYYLELGVTIADAGGTAEARINGVTEISFSGDTKNTANASANEILYTGGSANGPNTVDIDDYYACDGTGSAPTNTFLGDVRAALLVPSGAGNSTQWTPSTGSNFQTVDEVPPNNDTDYNESSTPGNKDTFAMGNMPTTPSAVYGVNLRLRHRKTDAGARTIRAVTRSGSTDYESGDISVSDSYVSTINLRTTDPNTSAAWTESGVNAMEAGYKDQAQMAERVTTAHGEVLYEPDAPALRVTSAHAAALYRPSSTPVRLTSLKAEVLYVDTGIAPGGGARFSIIWIDQLALTAASLKQYDLSVTGLG